MRKLEKVSNYNNITCFFKKLQLNFTASLLESNPSSTQKQGLKKGTSFANRIYRNLRSRLNARRALHKPTYSLADRLKQKEEPSNDDDGYNSDRENANEVCFQNFIIKSPILKSSKI